MRLYVNDCGVVCPLGQDKTAVVRHLDLGRAAFILRDDLIPGRAVRVGAVRLGGCLEQAVPAFWP